MQGSQVAQKPIKQDKCVDCGCDFESIGIVSFGGHVFYPASICEGCNEVRQQEHEKRSVEEAKIRLNKYVHQGIPSRYDNAKLSEILGLNKKIFDWIEKPDNFLFIHGGCGCGKTHLACAAVMTMRERGIKTDLVFSAKMFLKLKASFDKNSADSEKEVIEYLCQKHVFVFDDIGVQRVSEYVVDSWYSIIDERYSNNKPAMFTSNLSLPEISKAMGDRIASRLASGIVIELKGKDRRLQGA